MFVSNATLRKLNSKLIAQLEEVKSKNEELTTNQAALIKKNAELISQMDAVRDELVSKKDVSAGPKCRPLLWMSCSARGLNSWVSLREVSTLTRI